MFTTGLEDRDEVEDSDSIEDVGYRRMFLPATPCSERRTVTSEVRVEERILLECPLSRCCSVDMFRGLKNNIEASQTSWKRRECRDRHGAKKECSKLNESAQQKRKRDEQNREMSRTERREERNKGSNTQDITCTRHSTSTRLDKFRRWDLMMLQHPSLDSSAY